MARQTQQRTARRLVCLASAALKLFLPVTFTFMMFKTLCLVTHSRVPIVCVTSDSMAPTFHRGDFLLLWNRTSTVEVGDIPVMWFESSPLPMVHRVIKVHSMSKDEYVEERHPAFTPTSNF